MILISNYLYNYLEIDLNWKRNCKNMAWRGIGEKKLMMNLEN